MSKKTIVDLGKNSGLGKNLDLWMRRSENGVLKLDQYWDPRSDSFRVPTRELRIGDLIKAKEVVSGVSYATYPIKFPPLSKKEKEGFKRIHARWEVLNDKRRMYVRHKWCSGRGLRLTDGRTTPQRPSAISRIYRGAASTRCDICLTPFPPKVKTLIKMLRAAEEITDA